MMPRILPTLLVLLLGAIAPTLVSADIGVGVGGSAVTLAQPALAGRSYALTPMLVLNTGTEPARYTIRIQRLRPGSEQTAPPDWIQLGDNGFILGPKEEARVPVTINIPEDAAAGVYMTNLIASAAPPTAPVGGASLGAAAAARLVVTVSPPPPPPPPTQSEFPFGLPWPIPDWAPIALGITVGAGATFLVLRHFGISIQLQRRP